MARMKKAIPEYKTVIYNGIQYYRTRIEDADGKRVALYGKTREELYEKVQEAKRQIEEASSLIYQPVLIDEMSDEIYLKGVTLHFTFRIHHMYY